MRDRISRYLHGRLDVEVFHWQVQGHKSLFLRLARMPLGRRLLRLI